MLVKKSNRVAGAPADSALTGALGGRAAPQRLDRRSFLKRSGLAAGVGAVGAGLPFAMIEPAGAAKAAGDGAVEIKRTVCTHCSVGCAIDAEVKNGVWIGQEPVFDSPINLGAHCAKGASVREHGHGEHRLRTPMKLSGGKWVRMSWEAAIEEIGDKLLAIREQHGPDATHWIGSSKHSNEQAYLFCKFVRMFGTNNTDHQARICHSTTVAGVANTWGYGAMTNSYNDMQYSKAIFFIGSNAAEAHPVSMLHILHAKEGGARVIVADPRYTRTAAKADQYVRLRSGSDIALLYGVIRHIFENGWEDRKYIEDRVYGMEQIRDEAMQWTAEKVFEVTGVPDEEVRQIAETMALNRPSTVVWCMGQTQHTVGNAITRLMCNLQLVLGNVGIAGGGTNIFRGHDNVQGATDIGPNPDSLPGYYSVATGAWKHWCAVWGVDYEWMKGRFADQAMMEKAGITVSRWIDGVTENPELMDQATNIKAQVFWGMAPNSQTRGKDMLEAIKALEMLLVVDPYPSATAAMAASVRSDGVYLLPAATQFETYGSVTASNRSIQWREQVVEPLFESKPDHTILYAFAKKFGFGDEFVKNIKLNKDAKGWMEPDVEDTLREINRGTWTIGYSGQSPERLKLQMQHLATFNPRTLKAEGGPCDGEYFGLPWPCWGTPEMKHPGSPNLYDTTRHVMNGGGNFRARFGVEKDGVSLLAGEGSSSLDADLKMGYPEFDHVLLKKLGWWDELTAAEKAAAEGKNWKTDLSGGIIRVVMKNHGCMPYGNARARAVVWNFPDPVPKHREPLFSTRPDLVDKYPTHEDKKTHWRLPTLYKTVQDQYRDVGRDFPLIMTSGRLVEYEGGGEETRSNPWLAELQQDMFVELNPRTAADRGIVDKDWVWVKSPTGAQIKVRALVTERVDAATVFLPFHFSGRWMGEDMLRYYPEGAAPIVRGEAVNTATTYGYDVVTMMQETKSTVCQIAKA